MCVCVLHIATAYCAISFWQVNAASGGDRLVGADLTGLAWNSLSKICQMRAPSWSLAAAAFVAGMDEIEKSLVRFFQAWQTKTGTGAVLGSAAKVLHRHG